MATYPWVTGERWWRIADLDGTRSHDEELHKLTVIRTSKLPSMTAETSGKAVPGPNLLVCVQQKEERPVLPQQKSTTSDYLESSSGEQKGTLHLQQNIVCFDCDV